MLIFFSFFIHICILNLLYLLITVFFFYLFKCWALGSLKFPITRQEKKTNIPISTRPLHKADLSLRPLNKTVTIEYSGLSSWKALACARISDSRVGRENKNVETMAPSLSPVPVRFLHQCSQFLRIRDFKIGHYGRLGRLSRCHHAKHAWHFTVVLLGRYVFTVLCFVVRILNWKCSRLFYHPSLP